MVHFIGNKAVDQKKKNLRMEKLDSRTADKNWQSNILLQNALWCNLLLFIVILFISFIYFLAFYLIKINDKIK